MGALARACSMDSVIRHSPERTGQQFHLVRFSPSNEQCRRLFRQSGLGKRTKANRIDYLNRTLAHSRYIRQNELIEAQIGQRSAEALAAKYEHRTSYPHCQWNC